MTNKTKIRQEVRSKLSALSPLEQQEHQTQITQSLIASPLFMKAQKIASYFAIQSEIDLSHIWQEFPEKDFYFPSYEEESQAYTWRLAKNETDLELKKFGIYEARKTCPILASSELELCLVPGLAFSPNGTRLGRGGGFYDRLLAKSQAIHIGICHQIQTFPSITRENHDIRMDYLLSEDKFIKTQNDESFS